jgi:hypothetical protein
MPAQTLDACSYCGVPLTGTGLCAYHHHHPDDSQWATANRIMCDFIHRGIEPSRLSEPDRWGDAREEYEELRSAAVRVAA